MLKIKAIYIYFCTFIGKNDYKLVRKCRISGQEYILNFQNTFCIYIISQQRTYVYT